MIGIGQYSVSFYSKFFRDKNVIDYIHRRIIHLKPIEASIIDIWMRRLGQCIFQRCAFVDQFVPLTFMVAVEVTREDYWFVSCN